MSSPEKPTKNDWLRWISKLKSRYSIEEVRGHLKSPTFRVGHWRVGIEHLRDFKSVVLGWKSPLKMPKPATRWRTVSPSLQAKGWVYRIDLMPRELHTLLEKLTPSQPTIDQITADLEDRVVLALHDSRQTRLERLTNASRIPLKIVATATVFDRNADVVAEVLFRAKGVCEDCRIPAPFRRRSDGSPYLEVHHRVPLAEGGEDTVENAVALCPNCHRRKHYA